MKFRMRRFSSFVIVLVCALPLAFPLTLQGCAGSTAAHDAINQSIRQFQLAVSLREEGQTAGAIQHLRQAIELDEKNAEAHLLFGFVQMERRSFENAENHLKTGIDHLIDLDRKGATLAEARNIHGLCLIELGRFDDAAKVLQKSANDELNTEPHLAWGNLGLAYLKQEEWRSAIDATVEATRIQPRFCIGYYTMGKALFELSEFAKAEEALVRAIDADKECQSSPLLQGAWRLRGETRARLGHRRDAVADLERCIELGPHTNEGRTCQKLLQDR